MRGGEREKRERVTEREREIKRENIARKRWPINKLNFLHTFLDFYIFGGKYPADCYLFPRQICV